MGRRMAALPAHKVNIAVNRTPLNFAMPGGRRPLLGLVIFREVLFVDSSNCGCCGCVSPGAVNKGLVEYQTLAPSAMRTTLTIVYKA